MQMASCECKTKGSLPFTLSFKHSALSLTGSALFLLKELNWKQ